jgi:glycerol kinase
MKPAYILAIDQGTTGSTVLVVDDEGGVRGRAYSEFKQHFPQPGWVEHDAEEIWAVTHRVIGEAVAAAGITAAQVAAIGITNQRETVALWERSSGRPVHRAIVWQDRRTAERCRHLAGDDATGTIRRKTGLVLDPYFSATKIEWLLDHIEGLRARAERGELAAGTVDTWLAWKLSGGRLHATDPSNASRTMLFNIHACAWDEDLLEIFEIPRSLLPEVKPSSGVWGETDPTAFFGARVPIAGVAGDQQSALFGQACYGEGQAKNTYGTGSFILFHTGARPVSVPKLLTTVAWKLGDEPVEYALEGSVFITGAAIQWLRDGLGIIKAAAETEALARSLPSNEGVYFVPALAGLGAPYWDPDARGLIAGLTRGATRAHLARAALEAIAHQSCDVIDTMQSGRKSGLHLRELRADGGAVGNAFLMQFQADLLGVPVVVPKISETTALGAAYLAGLGAGIWAGRADIDARWRQAARYEPRMGEEERGRLRYEWKRAVERSRGWVEYEPAPPRM